MSLAWDVRLRCGAAVLPEGWEVRRVGDLVKLANGFPFPSESFGPSGNVPLVRIRDLGDGPFEMFVKSEAPSTVMIRDGDVVIGMDGDFNLVLWNKGSAALNQRLCMLRPRPGVDIRFVAYALPMALRIINDLTFSTTVKHLSSSDVLGERVMLPPLGEQRRIADFLDAETARIDRLASMRAAQLDLLAERERVALDEVFAKAKSVADTRLKYLLGVRPRYGVLVPQFVDVGVPFIRVNDLLDLEGRASGLRMIPEDLSVQYARTVVKPGDLLVSVVGTLGRSAIATESAAGANIARAVCSVRVAADVEVDLVRAWLGTTSFQKQAVDATSTDTAQPTLGMEDLANFTIEWPTSTEERRSLVNAIMATRSAMSRLRRGLEVQRTLLAERRQALISAAVTGQFDVSSASGRGVDVT
ncbi:restriction endonuclease subunit S [Streptacidiphilus carbonis]|uniref:restriction endonuclease subunit S n=1 Tax=Streptacidiphilus carbonis TaxID=105422 RepID=UPI0009FE87D2|nr:restriction endonuclease subunit S [Streptacidiphilus carbonis]